MNDSAIIKFAREILEVINAMPDKRGKYQRPYQTLGVRTFNRISAPLQAVGFARPAIDGDRISKRALRRTGLTCVTDEVFRESLHVLADSYDREAELTPFGRIVAHHHLIEIASIRMKVEQWFARKPEIGNETIQKPLFIVGLRRTGTRLLQQLLAQDTRHCSLSGLEAIWPAPPLRGRDLRRLKAKGVIQGIYHLAPRIPSLHPLCVDSPEECLPLLLNTFATPSYLLLARLPSYFRWLAGVPGDYLVSGYRFYRRQLQLIQWSRAECSKPWLLRSPDHLFALAAIRQVFPECRMIHLHRDPIQAIPSACSLFSATRAMISRQVNPRALGRELLDNAKVVLERAMRDRESFASDRICDVHYEQLVADPLATVQSIYEWFGLKFTDAFARNIQCLLRRYPAVRRRRHVYALDDFGLRSDRVQSVLARYCDTFDTRQSYSKALSE